PTRTPLDGSAKRWSRRTGRAGSKRARGRERSMGKAPASTASKNDGIGRRSAEPPALPALRQGASALVREELMPRVRGTPRGPACGPRAARPRASPSLWGSPRLGRGAGRLRRLEVPRARAARRGQRRRDASGREYSAAPASAGLELGRLAGAPRQTRRAQPDRLVQGPRDDGRRDRRKAPRGAGRRVRLDREHFGLARGV